MSLKRLAKFAKFGYLSAIIGVAVGIVGYVSLGAGAIAIGVVIVSYSNSGGTRIARYLPIALAVCLMVMAIALPSRR